LSDAAALARLRMRNICGSLEFLAPPFVSRQKVEKENLKQYSKCHSLNFNHQMLK
jgi:hypothetical protein